MMAFVRDNYPNAFPQARFLAHPEGAEQKQQFPAA